jgi:hypothetical protein
MERHANTPSYLTYNVGDNPGEQKALLMFMGTLLYTVYKLLANTMR